MKKKKMPACVDKPQAELKWFVTQSKDLGEEVGGIIVKEDTPADTRLVMLEGVIIVLFFSSRRRHTIWTGDWSSDVCSSDLPPSWRPGSTPRAGCREKHAPRP